MINKSAISEDAILYLSEKRTMFMGYLASTMKLQCAASTLIVSLDNEVKVVPENSERCCTCKSFLAPAGSSFGIDTQNAMIVLVFLDPFGHDFEILKSKMRNNVSSEKSNFEFFSELQNECLVIESARVLLDRQQEAAIAFEELESWIGETPEDMNFSVDARVIEAIDIIKSTASENISVEAIATQLNLSVGRLCQLFKNVTGMSIRKYRIWHRIFLAATEMATGRSITEAAISAGFSDAPHFSNRFKDIGGINPTLVFNSKRKTHIKILPSS